MNLTLGAEEQAFRDEFRSWLEANPPDSLDGPVEPALRQGWVAYEPRRGPRVFGSFDEEFEFGRRWQARMAADRWVGIQWPAEFGGRAATPLQWAIYNMEYARSRAPQPVNRTGLNLVGPTLLAHGTDEQRAKWLPGIRTADEIWCQLFSEPGAGSDLAGLSTRGIKTDDGFIIDGQKVWTSFAQFSRWGIALVRTDVDAPKHRGITCMAIDMRSPGVEVRPLMTMTAEAEFNEVFFNDVFVPAEHVIGGLNTGWAVANTTLAHERGTTFVFKEQVVHEVYLDELLSLAAASGALDDELIADQVVDAYVRLRLLRLHNWRTMTRLAHGLEPGPESSLAKLAWTDLTQHLSDAGLALLGPAAPLWGREAGHNIDGGRWQRQWLWSKAASIAGGTSEVQKTIIGERLLGLPR